MGQLGTLLSYSLLLYSYPPLHPTHPRPRHPPRPQGTADVLIIFPLLTPLARALSRATHPPWSHHAERKVAWAVDGGVAEQGDFFERGDFSSEGSWGKMLNLGPTGGDPPINCLGIGRTSPSGMQGSGGSRAHRPMSRRAWSGVCSPGCSTTSTGGCSVSWAPRIRSFPP